MIAGASVLAVITARGGSKGLPGKNIRDLAGKPLIAWTIEAARAAQLVDRTILSTDDEKIAAVAREFRCDVPFMREGRLATDAATSLDVVLDALDRVPGYDIVVLLQPTSPLRTAQDIDAAIHLCVEQGASSCVSVCVADKSPHWMFTRDAQTRLHPVLAERPTASRRQDLPEVLVLNGAVYVCRVDALRRERAFVTDGTVGYVMPKSRSVDIDTRFDLTLAEQLLQDSPDE